MKSSIKIDFQDSENSSRPGLQPVIKVKLIKSDDPRDSLLQAFFEALGADSKWLEVEFGNYAAQGSEPGLPSEKNFTILPVHYTEIKKMFSEACGILPPVKKRLLPDLPVFRVMDENRMDNGTLVIVADHPELLKQEDELIDANFVIGRIARIDGSDVYLLPGNVTAWSVNRHFQKGTTFAVISRQQE